MLTLNKSIKDTTVVVAMSGGVDSSTVASLLKEAGYNVIGITLQLYDYGMTVGKKGTCCAGQDIYDAKMVADKINIPHYVLDYESKFRTSVIDDFVDSYVRGETPIPCVRCNQSVKFVDLIKVAKELGADCLATGHYVRKIIGQNGPELHMGLDPQKDQSYFLFSTTKEQLAYLEFPLGNMTKEETRNHAKRFDLMVADKPDSQDICFVPNGSYSQLVAKLRPDSLKEGEIIHTDGYIIGKHHGIIHYTIGQRKGLGISSVDPLYVVKIDPEKNIVYVGPKSELETISYKIKEVNWLGLGGSVSEGLEVCVRNRLTHKLTAAKISRFVGQNEVMMELFSPDIGVTPGQACVMYDGTKMLGGGWITK